MRVKVNASTDPKNFELIGVFRGRAPKQCEEKGGGHRGRETTTALNGGLSLPLRS